jgi:hypothetical protein
MMIVDVVDGPSVCRVGEFVPPNRLPVSHCAWKHSNYCKEEPRFAVLQSMSKQPLRRYQARFSILGCFALLHAIRSAKPQNPSRLRRN